MADINKYGLKRYIPKNIQKEIRIRCGFGCVVCGSMFYTYEHFDPPFEDSKSHNPNGMTLLCGSHQLNKTRGFFPLSAVIKANANPYARKNGFWENLTFDSMPPTILLGNNETRYYRDIIIIEDKTILCIDPPEYINSPYLISGCFFDKENNKILSIDRNNITGNVENIDVITEGGLITIKSIEKKPTTFLQLSLKKQPVQFEISKINMTYKENKIEIDKDGLLSIRNRFGGGTKMYGSKFISQPLSSAFCIKIHSDGRIEGFGHH